MNQETNGKATQPTSLLGFEYSALVDDISKKSVGFQSTISKDCSQEELDQLLDKCRLAVTRQRIFAQIEAESINLKNLEENLSLAQRELSKLHESYLKRAEEHPGRAQRDLSGPEKNDMKAKIDNLENGKLLRESLKIKIEVLRQMVSVEAPSHFEAYSSNGERAGAQEGA